MEVEEKNAGRENFATENTILLQLPSLTTMSSTAMSLW